MRKLQLAILAGVLLGVSSASASFVSVGDPALTGSWQQGWSYNGGTVDTISGTMLVGLFDFVPGLAVDTTQPGWGVSSVSPTYGAIMGIPANSVGFTTHFDGSVLDSVSMLLQAYDGNILVEQVIATWTGGLNAEWDYTAVPETTTMLAGALLLLPFGASTIRILRKRQKA
jgi:hypothetical protein